MATVMTQDLTHRTTTSDRWIDKSVTITGALTLGAMTVAVIAHQLESWAMMAAALGAVGGVVHEFAQSGGKVVKFEAHTDGLYLGSAAGLILGAVAGALAVQGTVVLAAETAGLVVNPVALAYTAFLAGLALKGVTEAAAGAAPGSDSVSTALEDLKTKVESLAK